MLAADSSTDVVVLVRYRGNATAHVSWRRRNAQEAAMNQTFRFFVRTLIAGLLPITAWAGPVNINTADAKTLAKELDGIGPAKAQAIVEYREKNGAFKSADDLLKVEGIGSKVLEQNRGNIRVEKGSDSGSAKKGAAKTAAPPSS
jgi:competence protein ComEA